MTIKYSMIGTPSNLLQPKILAARLKAAGDGWYRCFVRGKDDEQDHTFVVNKSGGKYFWYDVNGFDCFEKDHNHLSYRVAKNLPKRHVYSMVNRDHVPPQLNCWGFVNQLESYFKDRRSSVKDAIIPMQNWFKYNPVN